MLRKEDRVRFKEGLEHMNLKGTTWVYKCESDEIESNGQKCVYLKGFSKIIPVHFLQKFNETK
ncbi:hypothetical protein KHA94_09130 [Bacillus sp. FJAT-49705]|uniref:Uncharacterized protein n=1 Tax=Cytobacillus citreus TaxID=2833586 RepID=A0ABS5NRB6_9BACI|nr:hypothetical protein [Cytobacillus citreus]MBS4190363.1 hypothetical protein [Cytobacillus citreus]